jgi:hypothetical protein
MVSTSAWNNPTAGLVLTPVPSSPFPKQLQPQNPGPLASTFISNLQDSKSSSHFPQPSALLLPQANGTLVLSRPASSYYWGKSSCPDSAEGFWPDFDLENGNPSPSV